MLKEDDTNVGLVPKLGEQQQQLAADHRRSLVPACHLRRQTQSSGFRL